MPKKGVLMVSCGVLLVGVFPADLTSAPSRTLPANSLTCQNFQPEKAAHMQTVGPHYSEADRRTRPGSTPPVPDFRHLIA